jgi:hypothetical protein
VFLYHLHFFVAKCRVQISKVCLILSGLEKPCGFFFCAELFSVKCFSVTIQRESSTFGTLKSHMIDYWFYVHEYSIQIQ